MVASDERLRVLTMVQEGKITAEEAVQLLEALEASESSARRKTPHKTSGPGAKLHSRARN